jgi:hypothetical protein
MVENEYKNAEDLYDALACLPGTEVFLLADGASVYGSEGLAGLRLIANAVFELVHGAGRRAGGEDASRVGAPAPTPGSPRLAEARAIVDRAGEASLDFVVCYHVEGEPGWPLAWSDNRSEEEAVRELLAFVRHGLLLDSCDC